MKQVELIRQRILRGQVTELRRLRAFISTTEGNAEIAEKMEGEEGNALLAKTIECIMEHLGHETEVKADSRTARSRSRRLVASGT